MNTNVEHQENSAAHLLEELKNFVVAEFEKLKGELHHGAQKPDGSAVNVHSLIDQSAARIVEAHEGLAYYAEQAGPAPTDPVVQEVVEHDEPTTATLADGTQIDAGKPAEGEGLDPVPEHSEGQESASGENGANS